MRRLFTILSAALFLTTACEKENIPPKVPQAIVVEGWIENDNFPIVILTKTLPVSDEYQNINELENLLIRWAKVTISDGTNSVVLTGRYDKMYYPPDVYTTSYMRGEVGKTYSLKVEYYDDVITAQTTIPAPPVIDRYKVEKCADSDTLYQITACFRDSPSEKNYYQFFTKEGTDTNHYIGCYLGSIDDAMIQGSAECPVYRGRTIQKFRSYTSFFSVNDKVSIKFAQVDETSYRFWDAFTKAQSLNDNMFFSPSASLPSNIHGGTGYWCGYGAINTHIVIADFIK